MEAPDRLVTANLNLPELYVEIVERASAGGREVYCDPDHVVFFLLNGSGYLPIKGHMGTIKFTRSGPVTAMPVGVQIVIDAEVRPLTRAAIIGFKPDHFESIAELPNGWAVDQLAKCQDIKSPSLEIYLRRLAEEVATPGFATPLVADALGIATIVSFSRYVRHESELRNSSPLAPWQLNRLRDYVTANIGEACRIDDLAALCGVGGRHLCRAFRKATGKTVHGFVQEVKFAAAKRLLIETDRSINDIACDVGFAHTPSFIAAFQKLAGDTPRSFRMKSRH